MTSGNYGICIWYEQVMLSESKKQFAKPQGLHLTRRVRDWGYGVWNYSYKSNFGWWRWIWCWIWFWIWCWIWCIWCWIWCWVWCWWGKKVLRDLIERNEREESEIKNDPSSSLLLSICRNQIDSSYTTKKHTHTDGRTHARTEHHISSYVTDQRERQQCKYYVTGRGQKVGIKLRTARSANSGQVDFKPTKRVMRMWEEGEESVRKSAFVSYG